MAGCVGRTGDFGLRRWVRYWPEPNPSYGTRRTRDRGVSQQDPLPERHAGTHQLRLIRKPIGY
jgi:hypothetical protein